MESDAFVRLADGKRKGFKGRAPSVRLKEKLFWML